MNYREGKRVTHERSEEYSSVYKTFKLLTECSSVSLRNKLAVSYPEIWDHTGNSHRSDERRIKRILDKLVDFGIAKREKIGKEKVYTYVHDDKKIEKIHKIANVLNIDFDDIDTYYERRKSIISLLNDVSSSYYIQTQQEDISNKENIIKDIEFAIEKKLNIKMTYTKGKVSKEYNLSPLKIAQFDGFWYLIVYSGAYIKYRIKNILFLEITEKTYQADLGDKLKLDEWHNSWHTPNIKQTKIKIFIDKNTFHYFEEKNILGVNTYKKRLTPCRDGIEYDIYITHLWELLPTLMQWQKHVTILEQVGEIDLIREYRQILNNALNQLTT